MNKKFTRILSFVLTAAMLLSVFSVFSFAVTPKSAADTVVTVLNRTFDDGWDFDNGMASGDHHVAGTFSLDYEVGDNFEYNYFGRVDVQDNSTKGPYRTLSHAAITSGGTVLEYDVKADCLTNTGNMYMMTTGSGSDRTNTTVFNIRNNSYIIYNGCSSAVNVGRIDDWVHIANVYNFDQDVVFCASCNTKYDLSARKSCASCGSKSVKHTITVQTYFSYRDSFDWENAIETTATSGFDLNKTYVVSSLIKLTLTDTLSAIGVFRLGLTGVQANSMGEGFCLDNIKFYYDATPTDENGNLVPMTIRSDLTVEKFGYGTAVDPNAASLIKENGVTQSAIVESGFAMKVGSDYMLAEGNKTYIYKNSYTGKAYGAPIKVNGIVYVPFEFLLDTTNYPTNVYDGSRYEISTKHGTSVITMGRDSAAVNGEKTDLTAAPFMAQDPDDPDNVYPVIAMADVELLFPGFYVTYDEMGLILIANIPDVFDRSSDLNMMIGLMKRFIFDFTSSTEMYSMIENNTDGFDHPYLVADEEQFEYLKNVYYAHVAMENGEEYNEEYINPTLYNMLRKAVSSGESLYTTFTKLPDQSKIVNSSYKNYAYVNTPEKYTRLAFEITNPFIGIKEGLEYTDSSTYRWDYLGDSGQTERYGRNGVNYNDGYDWAGGRNSAIVYYADYIQQIALAYRVTGDVKYAELAYDMMISLCDEYNWHHWAHKHFLSTSETLMRLAFAYDWLYDAWSEIQYDHGDEYSLAYITQKIYRKGIYYGYDVSRYARTSDVWTRDHATNKRDEEGYIYGIWNWSTTEINWNGVCSSGLVVAAMAIVGEEKKLEGVDFTKDDKEGVNRVMWTMTGNLWNLCNYGLSQYAPDGSYIEGAGYWSYATNYIAMLMWSVDHAVGDDLGLFEAWGFDKTFYFAVQSEYMTTSDNGAIGYAEWAYHDNGGGVQDSKMFFFAAQMLNDNALAAIRLEHIANGKGASWTDIVGYKPEYAEISMEDVVLDLDYRFEACEGVISRSSWEKGHTYVGLMGGPNNFGNHGQMDSGMFTYVDDGYDWIPDIGSDEYNVYEYFGYGIRQFYYRNSAEGHNQIILTSRQDVLPFGQAYEGNGYITDYHSEDAGMYAIIDNTTAYGSFANYADRGMLVTNNRETVVIQDELSFKNIETGYWIAHTLAAEIVISEDGRTAYLRQPVAGKNEYVRLTIVSNNSKLKFSQMTCALGDDDKLLDGIHSADYSMSMGGINERTRKNIKRLVIKMQDVLSLDFAVVIEDVEGFDSKAAVQYDLTKMEDWEVTENYTPKEGSTIGGGQVVEASLSDLERYAVQAGLLLDTGYAFSSNLSDFHRYLSIANAAAMNYDPQSFEDLGGIYSAYLVYLECIKQYNVFYKSVNGENEVARSIAKCMVGIGV